MEVTINSTLRTVHSVEDLVRAVSDALVREIRVIGRITDVPTLRLRPGQQLYGDGTAVLVFVGQSDGVVLSAENTVAGIALHADADARAISNDTSHASFGQFTLIDLSVTGQVQILGRDATKSGHVEIDQLDIVAADALARTEKPRGFGVEVLQGALTLWNMQPDAGSVITARIAGVTAGRADAPVLGTGIFVSGAGFDTGGALHVSLLQTGGIHSTGRLQAGTPDVITGGVFTLHGARVHEVQNSGVVVTYGVNDMALDNWGTVDRWLVDAPVTSFGPSGIGFVNFGTVAELRVKAPIETRGAGARGFNNYAGTIGTAEFDRIVTHADGAVAIQISQPIGSLTVHRGVETFGAAGPSLVKGVITQLAANGISIKPGGQVREINVEGGIKTHGAGSVPLELLGQVDYLRISGKTVATAQAAV